MDKNAKYVSIFTESISVAEMMDALNMALRALEADMADEEKAQLIEMCEKRYAKLKSQFK